MEQYVTEVDPSMVFLRDHIKTSSARSTPVPLPAHSSLPVDYSMSYSWQHQHSTETTGQPLAAHNQNNQRFLNSHIFSAQDQNFPRDGFIPGLDLRDPRLVALGGMVGETSHKEPANENPQRPDVETSSASRMSSLNCGSSSFNSNARPHETSSVSTSGVSDSNERINFIGSHGIENMINNSSSGTNPDLRNLANVNNCTVPNMTQSDSSTSRISVTSSFETSNTRSYDEFANKKPIGNNNVSTNAGTFPYDMSVNNVVSNIMRHNNGHGSNSNPEASTGQSIAKQEITVDSFPTNCDSDVPYSMQHVNTADGHDVKQTMNSYNYNNDGYGFRKDSAGNSSDDISSRIKPDPWSNGSVDNPQRDEDDDEFNLNPDSNDTHNENAPQMNSQIINDQEVFSCTHCGYKTPRKNYLKQHLRTHTGEGKVHCPLCNYSTVWRQRLKLHIINHGKDKKERTTPTKTNKSNVSSNFDDPNTELKRLKCEYCDYSTPNRNYLKQHTRTHTGDGTVSCPECNYKSVWRQRMKRHILSHRGEKEASCTHCSYSTYDREKLAKHIEAHNNEVYSCPICSFTTQRKTYMKQHTRTHTGEGKVQCPHCPYQTVWKQRLKLHIKKHTDGEAGTVRRNVSKLQCPQCDFKSCRKDRLRNHMKIHGNSIFMCEFCPYSTTSEELLKHHSETHAGISEQTTSRVQEDSMNDSYGDLLDVKNVPMDHVNTSTANENTESKNLIERINEITEMGKQIEDDGNQKRVENLCSSNEPTGGYSTTNLDAQKIKNSVAPDWKTTNFQPTPTESDCMKTRSVTPLESVSKQSDESQNTFDSVSTLAPVKPPVPSIVSQVMNSNNRAFPSHFNDIYQGLYSQCHIDPSLQAQQQPFLPSHSLAKFAHNPLNLPSSIYNGGCENSQPLESHITNLHTLGTASFPKQQPIVSDQLVQKDHEIFKPNAPNYGQIDNFFQTSQPSNSSDNNFRNLTASHNHEPVSTSSANLNTSTSLASLNSQQNMSYLYSQSATECSSKAESSSLREATNSPKNALIPTSVAYSSSSSY